MPPKLGILAGSGQLPARIVQACRDSGREYFVVAFENQADKGAFGDDPHVWVRLGAAGKAIEHLRAQHYKEAEPLLSQLVRQFPEHVDLQEALAIVLAAQGRLQPPPRTSRRWSN